MYYVMPKRKRGGHFASSEAKRRKQKEQHENETVEEHEPEWTPQTQATQKNITPSAQLAKPGTSAGVLKVRFKAVVSLIKE